MTDDRLTICFPLIGEILGGSHVSLKGLLDRLDRDKYRILIICDQNGSKISRFFDDFEQLPDPVSARRSFVVGEPFGWRKIAAGVRGLPKRARLLRAQKVHIVHTNDGQNHAYWGLAAKLAGTAHLWHHRSDPSARGIRFVAPLLADRIVAVSEFALPERRWGALRHARVIHSPFDVSAPIDRAAARRKLVEELGCREDAVLCGYFGLFIDRKRPLDFIAAVRELGKIAGKPAYGLLFGEAADDALYTRIRSSIAASGDDATIQLMGFRSPGIEWISACDLLLVPAIDEPLGRTLVEAMLAGTPIIATRSGGNSEALAPDHGVLVPPDDPAAMAEAAATLLRDPARCEAMTGEARKTAVTRFSSERHLSEIEQIYGQLRTARSAG